MTNMIERVAVAINQAMLLNDDYDSGMLARAAIDAMREPTKDMAQTVAWAYTAGVANPEMITKIYSAVVDAALAGK